MTPIITSLLDTDLYKFTMWQAMLHRNPQTTAEYRFACRNATAFPLAELEAYLAARLPRLLRRLGGTANYAVSESTEPSEAEGEGGA